MRDISSAFSRPLHLLICASKYSPSGTVGHAAALQHGAFMQDVDLFDASAYGLSAAEAAAMDPQHRQGSACNHACMHA